MSLYTMRPNGRYRLAKSLEKSTLGSRHPARPVGSGNPLFDALMKRAQTTPAPNTTEGTK